MRVGNRKASKGRDGAEKGWVRLVQKESPKTVKRTFQGILFEQKRLFPALFCEHSCTGDPSSVFVSCLFRSVLAAWHLLRPTWDKPDVSTG